MAFAITGVSWEHYQKHHQKEIFTIGMIALNYGQLENVFRRIFAAVTRLNASQLAAIFERLPNNNRENALAELLTSAPLNAKLKTEVNYFIKGFREHAKSRHAVMHAHIGGSTGFEKMEGIVLHNFSKSGKLQSCVPSMSMLREIADSMRDYAAWGYELVKSITDEIGQETAAASLDAARHFGHVYVPLLPSRGKPPPPPRMNWSDLSTPQGKPHRPQSSRA